MFARAARVVASLVLVAFPLVAQRRPPAPATAPAASLDSTWFAGMKWREIGPFRGGRVAAVAGDPANQLVFYAGVTGGGVWKTTDAGLTWKPVTDGQITSGSIGAVTVADADPNVVYVGTGENTLRGNVSPGDGMYRSTDAGKTWTKIGLADAGQIARIAVHPKDADLVYVAVIGHVFAPNPTRGVYRSKDGGKTWQKILSKNDSTGAIDLVLDPQNPRIVYAALWQAQRTPWGFSSGGAGSGLYKSTDGGDNWTELTRNKGMPEGVIGRIDIAVAPSSHDRLYAMVEAKEGGLYRSDDAGLTWTRVNDDHDIRQRAWYFSNVFADPQNPDAVYVLNTSLLKSVDGGRTFRAIRGSHGDHHALWIDPQNPRRMVNGNDGGVTVSLTGGDSWTSENNQPTAQFYHVIATTHYPYKLCGAQQDNSTVCIASRTDGNTIGDRDWYDVGGGESGWIAARADDPDVVFAGSYGGYLTRYDVRTGQERAVNPWPDNPMGHSAGDIKYRFQWTYPIVLAPANPNVLYAAAQVLFKSTDEGQTWQPISPDLTRNDKTKEESSGGPITKDNTSVEYYGTIFTVAPSPKDSNEIWVGTDDGFVQLTRDGGKSWSNVTPPGITAGTQVSTVEASPHDAGTAYVAATRYKLDDFAPYIYATTDYGKTWRKITTGIPATHFARVVREDPARRGLLYAGTEFGVYVSFDDGANWQSLRLNLPVVPVHDLVIKGNDLAAATHGRAFWVLDNLTALRQLTPDVAKSERTLFTPSDAVRGPGGGFDFPVSGVGRNPPAGAWIYFYLKQKPDSEVRLEIRDARDSVVQRWSTKPANPQDSLRLTAGLNRFVWDLSYPGAHRFPGIVLWAGGLGGPTAVPGAYKVRLSVGSWSDTKPFAVTLDPRVRYTAADLQKQFDFLVRVRERLSAANDAVKQIRDVTGQLDAAVARTKGQTGAAGIARQADSLKTKLGAIEREIYQTQNRSGEDPLNFPIRLNNRISALAGVAGSADAPPTASALTLFDELSQVLQVQLDALKGVLDKDVPAFNALVKQQDTPAVIVH
ncbi:MAG TPA: glycosyl hydrolase [Gemmatimonadales bacterium]|nr:glycosyl hydrolase [Gemmatimonadales bacterium]